MTFKNLDISEEKFLHSLLKKYIWQTEIQLENEAFGDLERGFVENSLTEAEELLEKVESE